jgi:hypothetical protein
MAEPITGGEATTLPVKSESKARKVKVKKVSYITAKELDQKLGDFQNSLIDAVKGLVSKQENPASVTLPADAPVSSAVSDARALAEAYDHASADGNAVLPQQYQKIFDKYFDAKDGFEARLNFPEIDEQGRESGGITFSIIVPLKFSNAGEAYLKHYKTDIRTRALRPDGISKGIVDWCIRVAKNLNYNRHLRTK